MCSNISVFVPGYADVLGLNGYGDPTPRSLNILGSVIDQSKRVVITHAQLDGLLDPLGTRLALQNGNLGKQTRVPETYRS